MVSRRLAPCGSLARPRGASYTPLHGEQAPGHSVQTHVGFTEIYMVGRVTRLTPRRVRRAVWLWPLLAFGIGVLIRLPLWRMVKYPGWGDYAFYYTVASNLVAGRGFVIDYIWHFWSRPESLTHYSNDYWLPLTSVILSAFMGILGNTLQGAVMASIVFGTSLGLLAYIMAWRRTRSLFVALSAMLLTLSNASLFTYSLITDTPVFYAFFAGWALFFMAEAVRNRRQAFRYLGGAALCTALANMTRQDGILLVFLLSLAAWIGEKTGRGRRLAWVWSLYMVGMLPLWALNMVYMGRPVAGNTFTTMFFRDYSDMYAYSRTIDWNYYVSWGLANIVRSKVYALAFNARTLYNHLPALMWALVAAGWASGLARYRRRFTSRAGLATWDLHLWAWGFLGLLYGVYSLIFTFPGIQGGFLRSSMAVLPFVMVLVAETVYRHVHPRWLAGVFMGVSIALLTYHSYTAARYTIVSNTRAGEALARIVPLLEAAGYDRDEVVLMTIAPWEAHVATGFKTIQIPTEDRDTIYFVAQRYGATHLLLPAKRDRFQALYEGREADPRFVLEGEVPNSPLKVYRIIYPAAEDASEAPTEPP